MNIHLVPVAGIPHDLPGGILGMDEIRIFDFSLSVGNGTYAAFDSVLDEHERSRGARFAYPHLRHAFVAAHGMVRHLLGGILGVGPAAVAFAAGSHGKPLCPALDARGVRHNLSHAHDRALLAVALGRDLGVDIECVRPMPDALDLAASHFHPIERAALPAGPSDAISQAFLSTWVRKESYVKARGDGLSMDLQSFHAHAPDTKTEVPWQTPDQPDCWFLADLDLGPGHVGAVTFSKADP